MAPAFEDIKRIIIEELNKAINTIYVCVAWFTDDDIRDVLLAKYQAGVDVRVITYIDGVNKKHGVDFLDIPHIERRGERGCIMHRKYGIIDNHVPIAGSFCSVFCVLFCVLCSELKRPDRVVSYNDFGTQMREQTLGIRTGRLKSDIGQNIRTNENVPIYFYYVIEENAYGAIKDDAKMKGFAETPFHSLFRTVNNTTQEIMTYVSMLNNARRNYIFFKKLGLENVLM